MLFNKIRKTEHYKQHHEESFSWAEVIRIIFQSSKNMKRKGNRDRNQEVLYFVRNQRSNAMGNKCKEEII